MSKFVTGDKVILSGLAMYLEIGDEAVILRFDPPDLPEFFAELKTKPYWRVLRLRDNKVGIVAETSLNRIDGSVTMQEIADRVNCSVGKVIEVAEQSASLHNLYLESIMNLSIKAKSLLRRIGKTEDYSLPITKQTAKAADELKNQELAVFIPKASGGADIALNAKGIEMAEGLPTNLPNED